MFTHIPRIARDTFDPLDLPKCKLTLVHFIELIYKELEKSHVDLK